MALKGVARVGDLVSGTCTAHSSSRAWTASLAVGTAGFTVDGLDVVAVGDEGPTSCGHTYRVTGGSAVLTGNGKVVARNGDAVIVVQGGTGTIKAGSLAVTSE